MPGGTWKGPGGWLRDKCQKTKLKKRKRKREEEQDTTGHMKPLKAARHEKTRKKFSPVVQRKGKYDKVLSFVETAVSSPPAESTTAVQHVAPLRGLSMAQIEAPVSATMGAEPSDSSTLPHLQSGSCSSSGVSSAVLPCVSPDNLFPSFFVLSVISSTHLCTLASSTQSTFLSGAADEMMEDPQLWAADEMMEDPLFRQHQRNLGAPPS